jgi:hypothetical protein
MRLTLHGIIDRGLANKERVHISVVLPANLSYYAILETRSIDGQTIVALGRQIYWFTALVVNPGDQVILYSCPGKNSSVRRPDGKMNHFFYWGFTKTIWHDLGARVVLFELNAWQASGQD